MLKTSQINYLLTNHPNYLGTFASNCLPPITQIPCSMIVNTAPDTHIGDHWTAIMMTTGGIMYFDSFGLPIIELDIYDYVKNYCAELVYNKTCIQHINSNYCGIFCIAFIKHVNCLDDFIMFVKRFSSTDLKLNDRIVMELL